MTITRIGDIIEPEQFTDYTIKRTMELSALLNSGILVNTPEYDNLASGPNKLVHLPYFEDLSGADEVMEDTGTIDPGKIETEEDVARKNARVKAFGANGLSAYLSGADPMAAIANLYAGYWNRRMQEVLLSTLTGIFNSTVGSTPDMSDKIHDIHQSGASSLADSNMIGAETFLDALQKMGDAKDDLTAVMMHSAVENYLAKQDLIDYVKESDASPRVPFFLGKRVIVDDGVTVSSSDATDSGALDCEAYLFGTGAIALGNGSHPRIEQTEVVREGMSYSGEDYIVNRKIFIMHPKGVKWTEEHLGKDGGSGDVKPWPTNAALEHGPNWQLVYEPKAVRIVKFVFNIV